MFIDSFFDDFWRFKKFLFPEKKSGFHLNSTGLRMDSGPIPDKSQVNQKSILAI